MLTPEQRSERSRKAAAIKNAKASEDAYNNYFSCPNICTDCNSIIQPKFKEGKKPSAAIFEAKQKRFCSSYCSALHSNSIPNRKYRTKKILKSCTCRKCGIAYEVEKYFKICEECKQPKINYSTRKRGEVMRQEVTRHAVTMIVGNKECVICGYSKFVEVCHIKAVSSFSKDTTLGVINDSSNLVYLCPNHHKEFDKNLLDESEKLLITAG